MLLETRNTQNFRLRRARTNQDNKNNDCSKYDLKFPEILKSVKKHCYAPNPYVRVWSARRFWRNPNARVRTTEIV